MLRRLVVWHLAVPLALALALAPRTLPERHLGPSAPPSEAVYQCSVRRERAPALAAKTNNHRTPRPMQSRLPDAFRGPWVSVDPWHGTKPSEFSRPRESGQRRALNGHTAAVDTAVGCQSPSGRGCGVVTGGIEGGERRWPVRKRWQASESAAKAKSSRQWPVTRDKRKRRRSGMHAIPPGAPCTKVVRSLLAARCTPLAAWRSAFTGGRRLAEHARKQPTRGTSRGHIRLQSETEGHPCPYAATRTSMVVAAAHIASDLGVSLCP